MFFPVVMYRCYSWTVKKAEHQGIDTFELWCYRRLPRVPWIERRSNQSILKEINPEYSWEGLMLKRQHFGHLIQRSDSLEKTLMPSRKIEGRRRRRNRGWDGWMASLTQWKEFEQTQGDSEGQGSLVCCMQFMRSKRVQHDWAMEQFFPCHVPINASDDTPLLKSLEHF